MATLALIVLIVERNIQYQVSNIKCHLAINTAAGYNALHNTRFYQMIAKEI